METTTKERRDALDEFAARTVPTGGALATLPPVPPPAHQIVGSQNVANRRDDREVLVKIRELAAAMGENWYYRFPVKNKRTGQTDWIEGPSIKLTNDVARIYGNCEVDCREQDLGSSFLFYARFVDLETGFALTRPFQQHKSAAKIGGDDIQRRDTMAEQIGVSKAERNVVANALQTFVDFAFEEAKDALVVKIGRDLDSWRAKIIERFSAKVDLKRVEAVIGRPAKNWLAPDIARVIAMGKAVEEGMSSLDETFPPLGKQQVVEQQQKGDLDAFANSGKGADEMPSSDAPAAGGSTSPQDPAPPAALHGVIDKMLDLACEPKLPIAARVDAIASLAGTYREQLADAPEGFVDALLATATLVAKGELLKGDARDDLQSLVKQ